MQDALPVRVPALDVAPPALAMAGVFLAIDGVGVLHDVSLTVHAGEIYGLLGPNGSGKSVTIAAALGLLPYRAGTIEAFGLDPTTQRRQIDACVGMLPQQLDLNGWMTASDYLHSFARQRRRELSQAGIEGYLEMVGLEPGSPRLISTYARGMRQRLGLARALVTDPALLILDEPFAGLDPHGRQQIRDLLLRLASQRGVAVLLCTHLLDAAQQLCTHIGLLVEGRITVEGELADLLKPPACDAVGGSQDRLPDWPATAADQGHHLLAAGWPTMEVGDRRRGLEELYLELTRPSTGRGSWAGPLAKDIGR